MDRVGSSTRRKAAASRRAAREGADTTSSSQHQDTSSDYNTTSSSSGLYRDVDYNQHHSAAVGDKSRRKPLENTLLSSLSQALSNIDKHNNDYFSHNNNNGNNRNSNGGLRHSDSETITFSSRHHDDDNDNNIIKSKYRSNLISTPPTQFASYIKFNRPSINCLLIFATCYLVVLICCYPMISIANLDEDAKTSATTEGGEYVMKRGASFQHIRGRNTFLSAKQSLQQELGTLKQRAVQWETNAKLKALDEIESLESSTIGRQDGRDAMKAGRLLEEAVGEFEGETDGGGVVAVQQHGHDHWEEAVKSWDQIVSQDDGSSNNNNNNLNEDTYRSLHGTKKPGFMVLGMHRSGTSMLSGLLVKGFGYETGGPLIGAAVSKSCLYLYCLPSR